MLLQSATFPRGRRMRWLLPSLRSSRRYSCTSLVLRLAPVYSPVVEFPANVPALETAPSYSSELKYVPLFR